MSESDKEILDSLTSAIVKKILHSPITVLKSRFSNSHADIPIEIVYELFGIEIPEVLTKRTTKDEDIHIVQLQK